MCERGAGRLLQSEEQRAAAAAAATLSLVAPLCSCAASPTSDRRDEPHRTRASLCRVDNQSKLRGGRATSGVWLQQLQLRSSVPLFPATHHERRQQQQAQRAEE